MTAAEQYFQGTGRRKRAVARVRIYPGSGDHVINDKPLEEVFTRPSHRTKILQPLVTTESLDRYRVQVKVAGGGITGWADAIAHGVARALLVADENNHSALRKAGHLTRDSRIKERKKYGLKRARKAPQYTKR